MDSYEATRIVFSRVQSLEPENGSKIMGYVLIQEHGDKEMIRLALGPESLVRQLIGEAKTHLGLVAPAPAPTTSFSPFSGVSRPGSLFSAGNGGFPASSGFSGGRSPNGLVSYANVVNGAGSGSALSPSLATFSFSGEVSGEVSGEFELQERLSFLNECKGDDLIDYGDTHLHRRCYSVPGVCFGSPEDPTAGFGWKPCLYFARGFCKNGTTCRFLHGGDGSPVVGSPEESSHNLLLRSKSAAAHYQNHKLAAASHLLAGVGAASFPYTKTVNLLHQEHENQRSAAAAALMIGDELLKFGRFRPERPDFPASGRQIYLTFPAESTFREEDVSNYFSIYGPVNDVRIPYQQKRMFGFVTFLYPETVKLILAKGNPHFVCDSRVLVKPYKEKGKVLEKKLQHIERGDYFSCEDPYELNFGAKMFYSTQEMLLKRKLEEQAGLRHAIELQERRLMNLQLLDLKNCHRQSFHQGLAVGSPIHSPTISHYPNIGDKSSEENGGSPVGEANGKEEEKPSNEECDLHENLEHILPDNLFASPKKSTAHNLTAFSSYDVLGSASSTTSALNMAPLQSCFLQMPRFSSGHGTIGL